MLNSWLLHIVPLDSRMGEGECLLRQLYIYMAADSRQKKRHRAEKSSQEHTAAEPPHLPGTL